MSETEKYLPQTAAALAKLQETAALLDTNADISIAKKEELETKLSSICQQLTDKAALIDNIINTLNGALK